MLIHCESGAAIYVEIEIQRLRSTVIVSFHVPSFSLSLGQVRLDAAAGLEVRSEPFTCENLSGYQLSLRPLAGMAWSEVHEVSDLRSSLIPCARMGQELCGEEADETEGLA